MQHQQGIATQAEKFCIPVKIGQLQHAPPDRGEIRIGISGVDDFTRVDCVTGIACDGKAGQQSLAVDLAARQQRHFGQPPDRRGDHVPRQSRAQPRQSIAGLRGVAIAGQECRKALAASACHFQHGGLGAAWHGAQMGLDFVQRDTHAVDLDQPVLAADQRQMSVLAQSHNVAGAIDSALVAA